MRLLSQHVRDNILQPFKQGFKITPFRDNISLAQKSTVESILDNSFMVTMVDKTNTIFATNESSAEGHGHKSVIDAIGKSMADTFKDDSVVISNAVNKSIFLNGIKKITDEQLIRLDDTIINRFSVKAPLYNQNGSLLGLIGFGIIVNKHSLLDYIESGINLGLFNSLHDLQTQAGSMQIDNCYLTKREKDILQLLVRGYSAKMIANDLKLSKRTVEYYLENIKSKLRVDSKSELIAKVFDYFI